MMQTKFIVLLALRILLVSASEGEPCAGTDSCIDAAHVSLLQESMHIASINVGQKEVPMVPMATVSGNTAVEWVAANDAPCASAEPCASDEPATTQAPAVEAKAPQAAPSAQRASVPWLVWAMLVFTAIVMGILLLQMCCVVVKKEPKEFVEEIKQERAFAPQIPVQRVVVPEMMSVPPMPVTHIPVSQVMAPSPVFVSAPVSTPVATALREPVTINPNFALAAHLPVAVASSSFSTSPVLVPPSMGSGTFGASVQAAPMTTISMPPTGMGSGTFGASVQAAPMTTISMPPTAGRF
jgi:hypothetical protein